MRVLVTGGAGYIGSHVCKALRECGYEVIVFDNLSHGHEWAIKSPFFYGDLQHFEDISHALGRFKPDAVIHLAGSIHLRESIEDPYQHYFNNVVGSLTLLKAMAKEGITSLVFSSSAAIYAPPQYLPIDEDHPKGPINPYGKTKWMTEQIFTDFHQAHGLNAVSLRYFNAAGADPSGEIGEAHDPETHLIPRLILTAQKKESHFTIYNTSLPTKDGTAVRDYVHVLDLAHAHIAALEWLNKHQRPEAFNLGTGIGYSVLEVIRKIEEFSKEPIPIQKENRAIAELPILIADPTKAKKELNWTPQYSDLTQIIETAWHWHESRALALL